MPCMCPHVLPVAVLYCLQYGKVYRGLWQGTEVAVKTIMLPANMSGACAPPSQLNSKSMQCSSSSSAAVLVCPDAWLLHPALGP